VSDRIGIVVIGRNEALRLAACLSSVSDNLNRTVYVDSGSTDRSAELAERCGAEVIRLSDGPFTAARGRRVGLEFIQSRFTAAKYVQFIDGDCEIDPGWIGAASNFLDTQASAAVVVGKLREKHPERSILIRLTDVEWELPVGKVDVIGGISMMRIEALLGVGGWKDGLVVGEELDLSSRLRSAGWTLHRLAEPMCTHDIGITRFREFWRRSFRAGYSYCGLSIMHRTDGPSRWRRRTIGSLIYGMVLPFGMLIGAAFAWQLAVLCGVLYASLPLRLAVARLRHGDSVWISAMHGGLTTVCKSAMAAGVLRCLFERAFGKKATLIEYKRQNHDSATFEKAGG